MPAALLQASGQTKEVISYLHLIRRGEIDEVNKPSVGGSVINSPLSRLVLELMVAVASELPTIRSQPDESKGEFCYAAS
jgi:hypothetical protein